MNVIKKLLPQKISSSFEIEQKFTNKCSRSVQQEHSKGKRGQGTSPLLTTELSQKISSSFDINNMYVEKEDKNNNFHSEKPFSVSIINEYEIIENYEGIQIYAFLEQNIPLCKDLCTLFGTKEPLRDISKCDSYRELKDLDLYSINRFNRQCAKVAEDILSSYQLFLKEKEDEILSNVSVESYEEPRAQLIEYFRRSLQACSSEEKYVYEKLFVQAEIREIMGAIQKLKAVSFEMIHQFLIDRVLKVKPERQAFKDYAFENEPGTILAMLKGFLFALQTRNDKKNREWFFKLHAICGTNVKVLKKLNYNDQPVELIDMLVSNTFRTYPCFLLANNYDSSPKGIEHLTSRSLGNQDVCKQYYKEYEEKGKVTFPVPLESTFFFFNTENGYMLSYVPWQVALMTKLMDQVFEVYQKGLDDSKSAEERLLCYLRLSWELEINHFFNDGNNRAMLLTFYSNLAADNDLSMAFYPEPNVFDFNDLEKIVYRTLEAMDYFYREVNKLTNEDISRRDDQPRNLLQFTSGPEAVKDLGRKLVKHFKGN